MSESSIIPYILVIVVFVTLGIILVLIRKKSDVILMNRKKTISPVGPIVGAIIAGQVLIAAFMFFGLSEENIDFITVESVTGKIDISNWATIIISVIAGGVVAFSVLIYSITMQNKTKKLLEEKKTYGLHKTKLLRNYLEF